MLWLKYLNMGVSASKSDVSDLSDNEAENNLDNTHPVESDNTCDMSSNNNLGNSHLTTDAALTSFPNAERVLFLENVTDIEAQLDSYELVSLIFLLYENASNALHELELWLSGSPRHILKQWVLQEMTKKSQVKWQQKLIEALCIIQNYKILKEFGFAKNTLISHYLPHRPETALYVCKTRKAIYCMLEKLNERKSEVFLNSVQANLEELRLSHKKFYHLEMYFLYWETIGYIAPPDFSNILKITKTLKDFEPIYLMLSDLSKTNQINQSNNDELNKFANDASFKRRISNSNDCQQSDIGSLGTVSFTDNNLSSLKEHNEIDDTMKYYIDQNNPGVCLIINQKNFYVEFEREKYQKLLPTDIDEQPFDERDGTDIDKNILKEVFKKFRYSVIEYDNLTHFEMKLKIEEVVKSIRNESSLFVCILSHGDKDVVYGVNSCKVNVSYIQKIMCRTNKHLASKAKVLILQSCQGKHCQILESNVEHEEAEDQYATDGLASNKPIVPPTANLLTFWATVPGYAAIRNKKTGTWFIQSLCKQMLENGNRLHFADICTKIVAEVTDKRWKKNDKEVTMTPMLVSTFTKVLYLPKI